MNRYFNVYRRITGHYKLEQVMSAAETALRSTVGGTIFRSGNTIRVENGTNNISLSFVGDFSANVAVSQPAEGVFDFQCAITLSPNATFWICAIAGLFCLWFLWIVNVLYFVVDPRQAYQNALDRIEFELPNTTAPPRQPPTAPGIAPSTPHEAYYPGHVDESAPEPPRKDPPFPRQATDETTWAMLAHLSAPAAALLGVTYIVGPLVIYFIKRDDSKFVADQAIEALNFQISVLILSVVLVVAAIAVAIAIAVALAAAQPDVAPFLGLFPFSIIAGLGSSLVAVFALIFSVVAAVESKRGVAYRYPYTFRLIR